MESKNEFLEIYKSQIIREGSDNLLSWLEKSDYFTAPASTNFHSACKGGLCKHSVKVYKRFIKLLESEYGTSWQETISPESVAICSLLHDICKVNFYKEDIRNVKVNGEWVQKPFYKVEDDLPYGHGEKSVYIISGFMRLSREEAMIINWHMGEFDLRIKGGSYSLPDVFYKYPCCLLFHNADVQASYLDETRGV
ncbi:MAG: hydrolase [Clostridia bacterium]|nr:hydrolase [Clostridia bacterium]MDD4685892.1 hydrolase [Clostridia bacterium]